MITISNSKKRCLFIFNTLSRLHYAKFSEPDRLTLNKDIQKRSFSSNNKISFKDATKFIMGQFWLFQDNVLQAKSSEKTVKNTDTKQILKDDIENFLNQMKVVGKEEPHLCSSCIIYQYQQPYKDIERKLSSTWNVWGFFFGVTFPLIVSNMYWALPFPIIMLAKYRRKLNELKEVRQKLIVRLELTPQQTLLVKYYQGKELAISDLSTIKLFHIAQDEKGDSVIMRISFLDERNKKQVNNIIIYNKQFTVIENVSLLKYVVHGRSDKITMSNVI